jgi:rubredoxin
MKESDVMAQYQCPDCSYIYDEAKGEAHEGFPPNTTWAQIPEDWACPDCAVRDKPDFVRMSLGDLEEKPGANSSFTASR